MLYIEIYILHKVLMQIVYQQYIWFLNASMSFRICDKNIYKTHTIVSWQNDFIYDIVGFLQLSSINDMLNV